MSAFRHRTDLELYQAAVQMACRRARWRQHAASGGTQYQTKRQCHLHARWLEAQIVDVAIQAELRCPRYS